MINSVPVTAIRGRATADYPYSVNFNKDTLIQTINRLMLFSTGSKDLTAYCKFEFGKDSVEISDIGVENVEKIYYNNDTTNIVDSYSAILDLNDIKATLENYTESYINFKFGDKSAIVICRGNVINIIPECVI